MTQVTKLKSLAAYLPPNQTGKVEILFGATSASVNKSNGAVTLEAASVPLWHQKSGPKLGGGLVFLYGTTDTAAEIKRAREYAELHKAQFRVQEWGVEVGRSPVGQVGFDEIAGEGFGLLHLQRCTSDVQQMFLEVMRELALKGPRSGWMDPSRARLSQIGQRPDLVIPALNSIREMDACRVFVAPIADIAAPGPAKSDWRYRFAAFVRPGPVITMQLPKHDFDLMQLPKWMKATIQEPAKRYIEARDRVQELIS